MVIIGNNNFAAYMLAVKRVADAMLARKGNSIPNSLAESSTEFNILFFTPSEGKREKDERIMHYRIVCPYAVGFDYAFEE